MKTSFSASVKAELCRMIPTKQCCALSECFGILLFCNQFSTDKLRIITESTDFAQMLPKLFYKAFGVQFDNLPQNSEKGKMVFEIQEPNKMKSILNGFGFSKETISIHLNLAVVEEECCRASFLRGAFLAGGSVTDPEKGYHFEMTTIHPGVAGESYRLMEEVLHFSPKLAVRGGNQVVYLKQSDLISDLLTYLGAPVAAMGIIEAKLEKELNNKVNRRCNCDDANISKVVDAAQEQLAAIRILEDVGLYDNLPSKLQQAAKARKENPASSLSDLAAMMEPPISKPAMNHRLKKLITMSREVKQ